MAIYGILRQSLAFYGIQLQLVPDISAFYGNLWHSPAFPGYLRHSTAFYGNLQHSPAFSGIPRHSSPIYGILRQSPAFSGNLRHSPAFYGNLWHSTAISGILRHSAPTCAGHLRILRQSLAFPGIPRLSPAFYGILRQSPAFSGILRHSPAFFANLRHSPAISSNLCRTLSAFVLSYVTVSARNWLQITMCWRMDAYAGECGWLPEGIVFRDQSHISLFRNSLFPLNPSFNDEYLY